MCINCVSNLYDGLTRRKYRLLLKLVGQNSKPKLLKQIKFDGLTFFDVTNRSSLTQKRVSSYISKFHTISLGPLKKGGKFVAKHNI